MQATPVRDQVVIEPQPEEKVSSGGIFIPTPDEESAKIGKVVAVGSGLVTKTGVVVTPEVSVGDVILYPETGHRVNVEGTEYWVVRESDILAILN